MCIKSVNLPKIVVISLAVTIASLACTKKNQSRLLSDSAAVSENPPAINFDDQGNIVLETTENNPNKIVKISNLSLDSMQGSFKPGTEFQEIGSIQVDAEIAIKRDNKTWNCISNLRIKDKKSDINCSPENNDPADSSDDTSTDPSTVDATGNDQDAFGDDSNMTVSNTIEDQNTVPDNTQTPTDKPTSSSATSTTDSDMSSSPNSRNQVSDNITNIFSRLAPTSYGLATTVEFAEKNPNGEYVIKPEILFKIIGDAQLDLIKSKFTDYGYVFAIDSLAVSAKIPPDGPLFDCPETKSDVWTACQPVKDPLR